MYIDLSNTDLSLWDFSTAFYAKPEIQSACLTLQDQYGVNVPLLLCCCWATLRIGVLPTPVLKELKKYTEAYSKQTIEPLRAIRKTMKNSHQASWPITEVDWQNLREGIKNIELESESLLLSGLEELVIASTLESFSHQHKEILRANCIANMTVCFEGLGIYQNNAKVCLYLILDDICSLQN